jgi:hypothetical protein
MGSGQDAYLRHSMQAPLTTDVEAALLVDEAMVRREGGGK